MLLPSTKVTVEMTVHDIGWLENFLGEAFSTGGWDQAAYDARDRIQAAIDAACKAAEG